MTSKLSSQHLLVTKRRKLCTDEKWNTITKEVRSICEEVCFVSEKNSDLKSNPPKRSDALKIEKCKRHCGGPNLVDGVHFTDEVNSRSRTVVVFLCLSAQDILTLENEDCYKNLVLCPWLFVADKWSDSVTHVVCYSDEKRYLLGKLHPEIAYCLAFEQRLVNMTWLRRALEQKQWVNEKDYLVGIRGDSFTTCLPGEFVQLDILFKDLVVLVLEPCMGNLNTGVFCQFIHRLGGTCIRCSYYSKFWENEAHIIVSGECLHNFCNTKVLEHIKKKELIVVSFDWFFECAKQNQLVSAENYVVMK